MKTIHSEFRNIHTELRKVGSFRKDVPALFQSNITNLKAAAHAASNDKARAKHISQKANGLQKVLDLYSDDFAKASTMSDVDKLLTNIRGGGFLRMDNYNEQQGLNLAIALMVGYIATQD